METFAVTNGDFTLANGAFTTVTGAPKVEQDIEVGTLTPYGSDRFHPRFGSVFSSYIGTPANPNTAALVQAELTRVITNYMKVQLWKVQQAVTQNVASPFSQSELVSSIGPINVQQTYDRYQITASVNTANGQQVNVSTAVSS